MLNVTVWRVALGRFEWRRERCVRKSQMLHLRWPNIMFAMSKCSINKFSQATGIGIW